MPTSEARISANRRNALRSTGPRTAAGKERSRANAIKHGLTGEGLALPTEDAAAVAGRFAALRDEIAPRTVLGSVLVKRVAMLSIRLDRFERREAAAMAGRVENAGVDFDEARMAEVERLIGELDDDPVGAVRKLRRMPEGVARLIAAWSSLRDDLGDGRDEDVHWYPLQCAIAERLAGHKPGGVGPSRIEALFRATGGDFRTIGRDEAADLTDHDRREWALARLTEIIDAHLAELIAHRPTLDLAPIARDRARAADRALVDPSKEAVLARKYEAAAERGLFRALQELRQVEAEAKAAEEAPLGSFSPDDGDNETQPTRAARRPMPGNPEAPKRGAYAPLVWLDADLETSGAFPERVI